MVRTFAVGLLMLGCVTWLPADEQPQPESWIVKEASPPVDSPVTQEGVDIIYRADFEGGIDGWHAEQDEEYKPWNKVELVSGNAFRHSKSCLRATVPNTWECLGPLREVSYREENTKVSFAYFAHHCTSVVAQSMNTDAKTNMHGEFKPFKAEMWDVGTVRVADFVTWSASSPNPRGAGFGTLMVYATCDMKFGDHYLLLDNIVLYRGDDKTPPQRISVLNGRVDRERGVVAIDWKEPVDNVGVAKFRIYRGIQSDFMPSLNTLVGTTPDISFADDTISNFGVFFYRVVAEDFAGNASKPSPALAVRVDEKE